MGKSGVDVPVYAFFRAQWVEAQAHFDAFVVEHPKVGQQVAKTRSSGQRQTPDLIRGTGFVISHIQTDPPREKFQLRTNFHTAGKFRFQVGIGSRIGQGGSRQAPEREVVLANATYQILAVAQVDQVNGLQGIGRSIIAHGGPASPDFTEVQYRRLHLQRVGKHQGAIHPRIKEAAVFRGQG